jgi:hypothetical protein
MTKEPKLIYDDCGFCTRAALFVSRESNIKLVPFSNAPLF